MVEERVTNLEKRCKHLEVVEARLAALEEKFDRLHRHQENIDVMVQKHKGTKDHQGYSKIVERIDHCGR